MGKRVIGIDMGADYLHIVEGICRGRSSEVYKAFSISTPQNAFSDGKIMNIEALVRVIETAIKEEKLCAKGAAITIQGVSVITRDLLISSENVEQLESIVQFNMAEYLTGDIDNYIVEFSVVNVQNEAGIKKYRVRAAAMLKEVVKTYYELLKRLKLKPEALDIHSNAFSKLVEKGTSINNIEISDKAYVFIDIGNRSTIVNITDNGILELSRSFGTGVREFTIAAAEYGGIKDENDIFKNLNINNVTDDSVLRPLINQWTGELQRVCQYYTTRMQGKGISSIYLYGGGAKILGIESVIRNVMNIDTKKIESISSLKFFTKAENIPKLDYLNAAGALITGKRG